MKRHSSGWQHSCLKLSSLVIISGSCRFSTLGISEIITCCLYVTRLVIEWCEGKLHTGSRSVVKPIPIPRSPLKSAHLGGGWPTDVCYSSLECSCWLRGHSPLWRGVVHSSRAEHGHWAGGDPHKYRHHHHSQSGALYRVLLQGQGGGVGRSRALQREAVLH